MHLKYLCFICLYKYRVHFTIERKMHRAFFRLIIQEIFFEL